MLAGPDAQVHPRRLLMNRRPWSWFRRTSRLAVRLHGSHQRIAVVELEDRTLLSCDNLPPLAVLAPSDTASGVLDDFTPAALFPVTVTEPGLLTVRTRTPPGSSLDTRTLLCGPDGQLLTQSDALAPGNSDDLFFQHLDPFTYYLEVERLGDGETPFTITTTFKPAADPFLPIGIGNDPRGSITADFNGDGIPDLAVANSSDNNVSILLGLGDGTFQEVSDENGTPIRPTVGTGPVALGVGDFNGDKIPDLAVVDRGVNDSQLGPQGVGDVTILLGNGDGTFRNTDAAGNPLRFGSLETPDALAVADLHGDGIADLAVVDAGSDQLEVLQSNGDGTFRETATLPTGATPTGVVVGDFNGDERLDVAVANRDDNSVSLFAQNNDGTFRPTGTYSVGNTPSALVAGDFNGDGALDLAVADANLDLETGNPTFKGDVSILLGKGDGTLHEAVTYPVGAAPLALVAGDFNGDGHLDLATTNHDSQDASVLPGNGDGTFGRALTAALQGSPFSLVAGDFNGDGRLDVAAGTNGPPAVTVLLGRGDATFQDRVIGVDQVNNPVGVTPVAVVSGDFNRDGIPDLVTANAGDQTLSVLLGEGDGSFRPQLRVPLNEAPAALVAADVNGDGLLDLVAVVAPVDQAGLPLPGHLDVFLGQGDGTFLRTSDPSTRQPLMIPVGRGPRAVVAADFNGDGFLDLAVADSDLGNNLVGPGDVSVLLGDGQGGFAPATPWPVGPGSGNFNPVSLAVGDVNGDGRPDLIAADRTSGTVSILLGNGNGTFQPAVMFPSAQEPGAAAGDLHVLAADFNGDGALDLAVADEAANDVAVLLGAGNGTFQTPVRYDVNFTPFALVAGDFNGDGRVDLATAGGTSDNIPVLVGNGDGTFQPRIDFNAFGASFALATADFNGDGLVDLASANQSPGDVTMLLAALNQGGLDFAPPIPGGSEQSTPLLVDVNGDGQPDSVVLSRSGRLLVRLGKADRPGAFAPPILVNPDRPARAVAAVHAGNQVLLAATDQFGSTIESPDGVISLYAFEPHSGRFRLYSDLVIPDGSQLIQIAAGNLAGQFDGFDDLAVLATVNERPRLAVFLSDCQGGFNPIPITADLQGDGPVDLNLANFASHDNGVLDALVTDRHSGDVDVLINNGNGEDFSLQDLFRAGTGLYGVVNPSFLAVRSGEETTGIALGDLNGDGNLDLVAANAGSNSLALLLGRGGGSLANPVRLPLTFSPTAVAIGRFDRDSAPDLAVLDGEAGLVHIFMGDGTGGFTERLQPDPLTGRPGPLAVGPGVTGLLAAINPSGVVDLQVSNDFGDVLTLLGNGDGTFQLPTRAETSVPLVTTDLNGDGRPDVILANQAADRVEAELLQPRTGTFTAGSFVRGRGDGLLGPGALRLADLNRDGLLDLIVANSGSNTVLVYLRQPDGNFGPPHAYFVGTNPIDLTVQDLNGDGLPDLAVANEGSNDVSILFDQADGTLRPGPRVRAGDGPLSTSFRDVTGDGIPDLIVVNGQDGTVSAVPGVGGGFFNDSRATTVDVPGNPRIESENQGYLVTADGTVLRSDPFDPGQPAFTTVFTSAASDQVTFVDPFVFPGQEVPALFAARSDDTVALLTSETGNAYTEARTFRDPSLLEPSMLEAVPEGNQLGLYVSDAGRDEPVLFTLQLGVPVPTGVPPSPQSEGELVGIAVLQPLPSSSVPTVPVLVAGHREEELLASALPLRGVESDLAAGGGPEAMIGENGQAETPAGTGPVVGLGSEVLALGGDDTDRGAESAAGDCDAPIRSLLMEGSQPAPPPDPGDLLPSAGDTTPGERNPDPLGPVQPEGTPTGPVRGSDDRPVRSESQLTCFWQALPVEDTGIVRTEALHFWWKSCPRPVPPPGQPGQASLQEGDQAVPSVAALMQFPAEDMGEGADAAGILTAALLLAATPAPLESPRSRHLAL
jgi:hypothetical protein